MTGWNIPKNEKKIPTYNEIFIRNNSRVKYDYITL
jgi:hypothetical protein